jgi:threonine aldolase
VTQPTPEMRAAMAKAEVGDDVYGEDPTVNQLQADAAAMFGKEAGLFVVSGTMGNLTSVLAHCQRGDEMILSKDAHIFRYEVGSAAAYGGVQPHTLPTDRDGMMDMAQIQRAIRSGNVHYPVTRLVCLENTVGASGAALTKAYTDAVAALAHENGLKLHIDGARIFNAAAVLNMDVKDLTANADSVSICLSKGLCAPVGSVIVGSQAFIRRAHHIRKSLGGGMRQAGILAAAGLIALHDMSRRVHEDHANARALAEGLAALPLIDLDLDLVRTNILFFRVKPDAPLSAETLSDRLRDEYNILITPYPGDPGLLRAVTHYWFKREHVAYVLDAVRAVLSPAYTAAD